MREPTWQRAEKKKKMSSFFLRSKGSSRDRKKRKPRSDKKVVGVKGQKPTTTKKKKSIDEEIASDSDAENESSQKRPRYVFERESGSEEENETAAEKRLRLAEQFLSELQGAEKEDEMAGDVDFEAIAHRLREDVLERAGKLQGQVADQYVSPDVETIRRFKGHQLSVTCVAITPDERHIYSGSKDCCIIKWKACSGTKVVIFSGRRHGIEGVVGHCGHVLALAVSSDGKYLASGGQDRVVHIWDVGTDLHLHTFRGHKNSVTGLSFQVGSHQLFSGSLDRTVKIWNLDEMAYVETLFGHQDGVSSIDCLQRERPVTAGTGDCSLRVWKVMEESQLVFHGHKASIDCVKLINEEHMISGSQDGGIAIWTFLKKKPLLTRPHYQPEEKEEGEGKEGTDEHWVTAVAAFPNTDLVASGSNDGYIRMWKCGQKFKSLEPLFKIPLHGFVNSLAFSPSGAYLVAGVGQEHKYGRWWREKSARNRVVLIPMCKRTSDSSD